MKTTIKTTIKAINYFLKDNEEFRKVFRGTTDDQFEQGLYYKSFSNQPKSAETDTSKNKKWNGG